MTTTSAPATAACGSGSRRTEPPVVRGDRAGASDRTSGVRRVARGAADPHVHAGGGAGQQPGVAHVAGAVAEEGDGEPGQLALVLADREQVGQQLAGVEVVGERVDDRDAGVRGHLLEVATGRRCARRSTAACRPSTRATSATDSRTPIPARRPSTSIGWPPSSAMPAANDAWVRRVGLSKIIATVRGPASGRASYGAAFSAAARSSTRACSAGVRSSSRRKCSGHVPRLRRPEASSRIAGQAARKASASSSVSTSGGASRIRSGVGLLTMKPCLERGRGDLGRRRRRRGRGRSAGPRRAPR